MEGEKGGAGALGGGIGVVDEAETAGGESAPIDAGGVAGGLGKDASPILYNITRAFPYII